MQVMYSLSIDLHQHAREKIGLLLIVALQANSVARFNQLFHGLDDFPAVQYSIAAEPSDALQPSILAFPSGGPGFLGGNLHAVHGKVTAPGSKFDHVYRSHKFPNCAAKPQNS
jgi:hypothetical protein